MRTSSLRIDDFEILLEVGRTLNFSRAGEAMLYSPQRLHQRVRAIEAELGVQLFVREGRGLALTAAGKAFLVEAQTVLDAARRLEGLTRDFRTVKSETVMIAASYPPLEFLPSLIAQAEALVPNVRILLDAVDNLSAPEIPRRVASAAIDIGFVGETQAIAASEAVQGLTYTRWRESYTVIAVGAACFDKFMREMELNQRVPLLAAAGSPNASRVIAAWRDQGIEADFTEVGRVASVATYEALKQSALAGLGVAILPLASIQHELEMGLMRRFPSPVDSISYPLFMVTRPGRRRPAVERVFRFFESVKHEALPERLAVLDRSAHRNPVEG
jgi:DNA-binding transcriptional LysR family regulator